MGIEGAAVPAPLATEADLRQELAWLKDASGAAATDLAEALLPALEQVPVLAVDGSADALQLLSRYAAGSRYRLVGTRDPAAALALATSDQ